MDFQLADEQQLLADSVQRFVEEHYALESRIELQSTPQGFSDEHWQQMADLGWFGLPFSEEDGGFGGTQIDTMIMMEQFGKGLVLEPYLSSIILGAGVLKRAGTAEQKARLLPGVMDGSTKLALAYAEEHSRFDVTDVTTSGVMRDDKLTVNGTKCMVIHGGAADQFVVSVRTSGGQVDEQGLTMVLIPASADGVAIESFPTVDGLQAANITFTNVEVASDNILGDIDEGFDALDATVTDGILALSAEALGALEILYKDTVAYTQEREQFDQALSEFQVLQHRMVEMFMEYEQCKSMLYRATMEVATGAAGAQRSVHALKHLIGKSGYFIGENAVQLHGGMGVTEELRVGHYFKRMIVLDAQFGNSDYHLEKLAA